jgi:predicted TIM-barrel fold metal-dependent hydrolase
MPACLEELQRIKTELSLDGVVWKPSASGELINEARTIKLSKEINAAGLPIFIHLMAPGLHEAPHYFESLSKAAPECNFIGLGALSSLDNQHDLRAIAARCPNLMLDTSHLLPTGPVIEDYAELIGSERLIFGTDVYSPRQRHFPGVLVDIIESERLSEQDKENILWRNAERLFPRLKELN